MCKAHVPSAESNPVPAYTLGKWVWAPAAVALGAWMLAWGPERETGAWDPALPTWDAGYPVFLLCEIVRLGGVRLLPVWWKRVAGRADLPAPDIQETFGGNLVSLGMSLYLIGNLLVGYSGRLTDELPFWHANGDNRTLCHGLSVTMLAYLLHDLLQICRCWRVVPNPAMVAHHVVFIVITGLGTTYPQPLYLYRVHAILFSAEASTPLLNSRWILRNIVRLNKNAAVMTAISLGFFLLFTTTRIGLYLFLIMDLFRRTGELGMPPPFQKVFTAAVALSYLINLHWFSVIIETLRKRKVRTPSTDTPSSGLAAKPAPAEATGARAPGAGGSLKVE